MTNAKFEVEKFNGTNNFGMRRFKVLDVLCQQELDLTLEEKPDKMDDKEWIKINKQTCGTKGDISKEIMEDTRRQVHEEKP